MPKITEEVKNYVLLLGALLGLASGAYAVIAKPIQDQNKLAVLETKMALIEPSVREHETNIAVLRSQLAGIKDDQGKILDAVLEIRKKL